MRFAPLLALALFLVVPPALAQTPSTAMDATIDLAPTGAPSIDAPGRFVRFNDSTPGERFLFDLTLEREYTTIEVRASGFPIERNTQLVPSLLVPETEYPLFHDFPNERIWEADSPVNVFHVQGPARDLVLRLGVAGPRNVTLALTLDTTPPTFTIRDRQNMTHIGFYQETTTSELALGNLQVRRAGAAEWIENPTPAFHVLQRFPIQGLNAATAYETRFVFTDRAGNAVTSEMDTFVTPDAPDLPKPIVRILSPEPNATFPAGTLSIRASIESDPPVTREGIRLFFDKHERADFEYNGTEVLFTPPTALLPGRHSVAIEATNEAGGEADARWTFEIEGANDAPLPAWVALLAAAFALLRRR